MSPLPIITGLGLATPLGATPHVTWHALLAGHFISTHSRAKLDLASAPSRISALARTVATQALTQSAWQQGGDPSLTALLIATSKGPIEQWLIDATAVLSTSEGPEQYGRKRSALTTSIPLGLADLATDLATHLGWLQCPRLTLSAACASGLHALIRAALLLQSGQVTRALVVAAESSLHPLFAASFQRLGVLPREEIGCRPFDATRDGFLISEAAAAVCLEIPSWQSGRPVAALDAFALGGDATHLTATDPAALTLRHLLRQTARNLPIDLVHAHATGTVANDPIELAAIEQTLGSAQSPPILYSHKGALGHSLGAAGLVSVVLNCLAHSHSRVPPNARTAHPLPMNHLIFPTHPIDRRIRRSLAVASGFGGPTAVVSLVSP